MKDRKKLADFAKPVTAPAEKEPRTLKREDIWEMLRGEDGKTPKKGEDFFTDEDVKEVVAKVMESITLPKDGLDGLDGKDGVDGKDGKDGKDSDEGIIISRVLDLIQIPKDGKDADEAKIVKAVTKEVSEALRRDFPSSAKDIVKKIVESEEKIPVKAIEGLEKKLESHREEMKSSIQKNIRTTGGQTALNIKNAGAKVGQVETVNFIGATITPIGDGREIDVTVTGGSVSPLTTKGDLYGYSNANARIPVGANGTVLTADSAEVLGVKWAAVSGTGDVVGPASAVNNRVAFFDGITGKLIKDSGLTLSGSNTGDQTITLTGDVTGTGTGSFATTIANAAVSLAKMADVATSTIFYRKTAGAGVPEVQTLATLKTDLGLTGTNSGDQTITLTGGVTGSGTGSFAATVVTNANLTGVVTSVGNATAIADAALSIAKTSGLQAALDLKAPLTSPTFATSVTGSYLTASEIVITDASKNIVSAPVATYPSLTELTYVKGVTSAIQTQLNGKQATITFGTGVQTALGVNIGSAGAPVLFNGALGTPSSGTLTNATGLPIAGLVASTSTAIGVGSIELGHATDTTITRVSAGVAAIEGANIIVSGGALGTPSSGTLTNATGLPVAGITSSTSTALGVGSLELGHASDTTLSRSAAGVLAVEGVVIPSISSTNTITNKRNQPRTASSTTAATLTPDLSSANVYFRTTQTATLTLEAPIGTPVIGETIAIYVDSAAAQTLTINATYKAFGAAFPAATTAGKTFMLVAQFNGTDWKSTWNNAV